MHEPDFIRLCLELGVLRFGDFRLKSGRQSPYFFNAGLFNTGRAIAALGRTLTDDEVPDVRRRAAWALGQIEDEAALAALEGGLRDQAPEVRQMVVWAIGEIESPKGVAILRSVGARSSQLSNNTSGRSGRCTCSLSSRRNVTQT